MTNIEIFHRDLSRATLHVDHNEISQVSGNLANWYIDHYGQIKIYFEPFKIKPMIRVDNFLINYWLADVFQEDHAVSFALDQTFFERYRAKDLQGRLNSLGPTPSALTTDRVVGREFHSDLVEKIQLKINEASNLS